MGQLRREMFEFLVNFRWGAAASSMMRANFAVRFRGDLTLKNVFVEKGIFGRA